MEIKSNSNLVSPETDETIIVYNFQTMKSLNFFCYVMWFDEKTNRKPCERDIIDL